MVVIYSLSSVDTLASSNATFLPCLFLIVRQFAGIGLMRTLLHFHALFLERFSVFERTLPFAILGLRTLLYLTVKVIALLPTMN
ncbi:unnamed protein product [Protopolystoma xenopodis]|uniref:Uncharacterized protein n=1 Tax=Protopolystoma xenopodis TaxID=117903 RepID=A0A448WD60_9PLAT|nr:unnamed protein product [Protopolystoma xenopodis]